LEATPHSNSQQKCKGPTLGNGARHFQRNQKNQTSAMRKRSSFGNQPM